jgi:hypothetical protein
LQPPVRSIERSLVQSQGGMEIFNKNISPVDYEGWWIRSSSAIYVPNIPGIPKSPHNARDGNNVRNYKNALTLFYYAVKHLPSLIYFLNFQFIFFYATYILVITRPQLTKYIQALSILCTGKVLPELLKGACT